MAPKRRNNTISKHLETPKKNQIRGAAKFCDDNGIKYTKKSLATTFEATRSQVDYALQSAEPRTGRWSESKKDNPKKLSKRDLDRVERVINDNSSEGH